MDSNHRPSGYEPDELPLLHAAIGMAHGSSLPAVLPPVPSALPRFTTRFGMERGGPTALRARHWLRGQCRVSWMAEYDRFIHRRSSRREALVHALPSPAPLAGPPARAAYPVISWGLTRL